MCNNQMKLATNNGNYTNSNTVQFPSLPPWVDLRHYYTNIHLAYQSLMPAWCYLCRSKSKLGFNHITMAHVPIQYLEPVSSAYVQIISNENSFDSENGATTITKRQFWWSNPWFLEYRNRIPRTDKFPSSIWWLKCGHWHCARTLRSYH